MIEQAAIFAGIYFLIFRKFHDWQLIGYAAPLFRALDGSKAQPAASAVIGSMGLLYDAWRRCAFCFALPCAVAANWSLEAFGVAFVALIFVALFDALNSVVLIAYQDIR